MTFSSAQVGLGCQFVVSFGELLRTSFGFADAKWTVMRKVMEMKCACCSTTVLMIIKNLQNARDIL